MNIKFEAVVHYLRMMFWAMERHDEYHILLIDKIGIIESELGEHWYSGYCSYCREHRKVCSSCNLWSARGCCDGLWGKMSKAKTWKKWVFWATKVLQYIIENG